jgi:hypothetical protein
MPQQTARAGERITVSLVWQALRKIDRELEARLTLRGADGSMLVQQILPIGAPEHGTSTWQEGEVAEQPFTLVVPQEATLGAATVEVALAGRDGRDLSLGDRAAIELARLEIVP